jgi:peroxiredoxin
MISFLTFAFLAFFQSPVAPSQDRAVPLRDGCSADDQEVARITATDPVEVHQAIAGGDGICYKITLLRDGKPVAGYVIGETLPAIAAFVQERQRESEVRLEAQARQPIAQAVAPKPAAAENLEPPAKLEVFENFSAHDVKGKMISLSSLPGRVILVTFWSSKSGTSKGNLMSIIPLYNQYKRAGLSAIGVSMDAGSKGLSQALDDITLAWPQVSDPGGLAKRYGVDPRAGKTFVLDQSRRIVASGSASEMARKVRELLAQP